jgi:hypothetical protein
MRLALSVEVTPARPFVVASELDLEHMALHNVYSAKFELSTRCPFAADWSIA